MIFMDQHTFEVDSPPIFIPHYHVKAHVTITNIYNFHLRAAIIDGEGATEKQLLEHYGGIEKYGPRT